MAPDAPKATAQDVIDVLRSIEHYMKDVSETLATMAEHSGALRSKALQTPAANDVPAIASAADLDSKYGDPEVKAKSPRDWTGETQQGKHFSQCPAEYLDLVASRLDYFAEMNAGSEDADDRKKARYNRLDASRARGWAQRNRAGWTAPVEAGGFPSDNGAQVPDDEIAF